MFTPEKLETRRLLSVAIEYQPKTMELNVLGGTKPAEIRVLLVNTDPQLATLANATSEKLVDGQRTVVNGQRPAKIPGKPGPLIQGVSVYDGTELIFNSTADNVMVTRVNIYGTEGPDQINTVVWNAPQVSSFVYAGAGDDTLFTSATEGLMTKLFGEDGNDALGMSFSNWAGDFLAADGGAGNDMIDVTGSVFVESPQEGRGGGDCFVQTRMLIGGEGDDIVRADLDSNVSGATGYLVLAGPGDDLIHGSAFLDALYGEEGQDQIYAGAGDDYVNGGFDTDWLYGEDGDDYLDHGGGTDYLNGGNGFDQAIGGKDDEFIDIEEVLT